MNGTYRFLVRGHLDDRWSEWLGGLAIQRLEDGTSVLTGAVPDQATLHGVIARIRDMGLPLLAVESTVEGEEVARISQPGARGSPAQVGSAHEDPTLNDELTGRLNDFEGDIPCD